MQKYRKVCTVYPKQVELTMSNSSNILQKEGMYLRASPQDFSNTTNPLHVYLIVDNFGAKYTNKDDANYLVDHLNKEYTTTVDWRGKVYVGLHLNWGYLARTVELSIPGYVESVLKSLQLKQHA